MTRRLRPAAAFLSFGLFVAACTGSSPITPGTGAPVPSSPETASPATAGPGSAQAALKKLCPHPGQPSTAPTAGGPTPPAVRQVEQQVEQMRKLSFTHPVPVDAVSHDQLVRGLSRSFESSYPSELYDRRSRAWQTLGVVPGGTSIRRSIERFAGTQVIGYYDPLTGQLVFMGSNDPSPVEKVTLAHELTHALDDQHYSLDRLNTLENGCQDEAYQAALGAVEGNATFFMILYAQRYLTLGEQLQIGSGAGPSTAGVPPFVVRLEIWPYAAGLAFIEARDRGGGIPAINRAIQHFPVSTEQVMHPERYPNDAPTPVNIGDLGPNLGAGWTDLDVMGIGEAFLSIMLGLRLPLSTADSAAAGWDGGIYRAWSDGNRVALELSTAWDTPADATQFASAMRAWLGDRRSAAVRPVEGKNVTVLFASDPRTLEDLRAAA